jgi:hypothetical protein
VLAVPGSNAATGKATLGRTSQKAFDTLVTATGFEPKLLAGVRMVCCVAGPSWCIDVVAVHEHDAGVISVHGRARVLGDRVQSLVAGLECLQLKSHTGIQVIT